MCLYERNKDIKKFKINIKSYNSIDLYVVARNKKEAKKMVQDVLDNSNLLEVIKTTNQDYCYKVTEEDSNHEQNS